MASYTVTFLGRDGKPFESNDFDAENDAAAIARAEELCDQNPACAAIEIWLGARRLHRHEPAR